MEQVENLSKNNTLYLNLDSYEGPIDLLLDLARNQKVDLSKISILALANQYLDYIKIIKNINLELASDYLVMAAWLTYLKSRLLLPKKDDVEEPSAEDLEEAMKFQLQRLEAMQKTSKELFKLPQLGKEIFIRGSAEGIKTKYIITYKSNLYDLLKAYGSQVSKSKSNTLKIAVSDLYSVDEAINRIKNIFNDSSEWIEFSEIIPSLGKNHLINKSALSSTFIASLELVKNGLLEVKQSEIYGPILLKSKS